MDVWHMLFKKATSINLIHAPGPEYIVDRTRAAKCTSCSTHGQNVCRDQGMYTLTRRKRSRIYLQWDQPGLKSQPWGQLTTTRMRSSLRPSLDMAIRWNRGAVPSKLEQHLQINNKSNLSKPSLSWTSDLISAGAKHLPHH